MVDDPTPPVPTPPAEDAVPAIPLPSSPETSAVVAGEIPEEVTPKRKLWPWFLGGGIALFLLLVAGIVIAVTAVIGSLGGGPSSTVLDYDRAFATADCALFEKVTTEQFRDGFFTEAFSCAPWVENAELLQVDGKYTYSVVVESTEVFGDTAEVATTETDVSTGEAQVYKLLYSLVLSDGVWLIDGISEG